MKSQSESVEKLVQIMKRRRSSAQLEQLNEADEEWTIKKSQFYGLINNVLDKLNASEQRVEHLQVRLGESEEEGQRKQEKIVSLEQEMERMKHLLPIKEAMIKQQRLEVQKLELKVKVLEKEAEGRLSALKINGHTTRLRLDQLGQNSSEDYSEPRNFSSTYRTIRRSSKQTDQNNYQKDLQIARLKTQLTKLKSLVRTLKVQAEILKIQNQHLDDQCQLTSNRERQLTFTLSEMFSSEGGPEEIQTWSEKCQEMDFFVQQMSQKVQFGLQPSKKGKNRYELHPPTPHFSSSTGFCFSKRIKIPEVQASSASMREEVSLGEVSLG